jgi:hypothetical protein
LGRQSDWSRNKAIDRHPRGVPSLHRPVAYGAFIARDLSRLRHVFRAVIDRPASAGPVMRRLHLPMMRRESKLGHCKILGQGGKCGQCWRFVTVVIVAFSRRVSNIIQRTPRASA